MIPDLIWVAVGAIPGAWCRYYLSVWALKTWGTHFPWGTLLVNLSGSFLIGLAWHISSELPTSIKVMLLTGFFGAYTTFSTYALDTINLGRNTRGYKNLVYGVGSPLGGLLMGELGIKLGQLWF